MAGMSSLRPVLRQGLKALPNGFKPVQAPVLKQMQLLGQMSVRNGGGHNKMSIVPSRYEWNRFKDDLHFYFMLGLIPIAGVVTYANLVVGPAELSDIPEGYEPKEWEYYQSPIKRWFAKYLFQSPQKEYEKTLHYLQIKADERYWNLLDRKVKTLAADRQDYKGWYWLEVNKGLREYGKNLVELDDQQKGN